MSPLLPGIIASGISGHLFTLEGSAYEIASYTVPSGGIASVTFPIPSGYRHLEFQSVAKTTAAGTSSIDMHYRFNGDSAANYSIHYMLSSGSGTPGAAGGSGTTWARQNWAVTSAGSTNTFGATIAQILDYSSTTKAKTLRSVGAVELNGSGGMSIDSSAWYNSTSPITSVMLYPGSGNFAEHSTFTLIGYK